MSSPLTTLLFDLKAYAQGVNQYIPENLSQRVWNLHVCLIKYFVTDFLMRSKRQQEHEAIDFGPPRSNSLSESKW